jgi:hypothetical protein
MAPSVPVPVLVAVAGCSLALGYLAGQSGSTGPSGGASSTRFEFSNSIHGREVRPLDDRASRTNNQESAPDGDDAVHLDAVPSTTQPSAQDAIVAATGEPSGAGKKTAPVGQHNDMHRMRGTVGTGLGGWGCCVQATPTCHACIDMATFAPNGTAVEWVGDARSAAIDKSRGPCYKGGGKCGRTQPLCLHGRLNTTMDVNACKCYNLESRCFTPMPRQ